MKCAVVPLIIVGLSLAGCVNPREYNESTLQQNSVCQSPVDVVAQMAKRRSCAAGVENKRHLYDWVPCNSVQLLSHDQDVRSYNQDIIDYLAQEDAPFKPYMIAPVFANPEKNDFPWERGNPILGRPIASAIRELIASANESVFYNIFLLGGTWGLDIARELARAANRGVKVLVLRDTDNKVGVGPEMEPLWESLLKYAADHPNLTVLRSEINRRPSAIPFGLNNLLQGFDGVGDFPVSLAGKSDHSKILVVDAFTAVPRMLVGSKNTVDTAGAFFYDEAIVVEGPAAAAGKLAYFEDLTLARNLARREGGSWDSWLDSLLTDLHQRRSGQKPTLVAPHGTTDVLLAENNGDDSVRNVEHTVLNLIVNARRSIDVYNFLSYNPAVGEALANAIQRGVKVRVLLDALSNKMALNATLAYFMRDAGAGSDLDALGLRWRKQVSAVTFPASAERLTLAQQQHVKTMIVDDSIVLVGSANFDAGTFTGGFREMSVAVRDAEIGKQAKLNFETIYNSGEHSSGFTDILNQNRNLLDRFKVKVVMDVLRTEALRIKAMRARDISQGCGP